MNPKSHQLKNLFRFFYLTVFAFILLGASQANAQSQRYAYGVVKGSVVDQNGKPLAGAVVTIVREGANEVIKEVRSAANGSFIAKVSPGRYIIRAVANGFSAFAFPAVQLNRSAELVYRFNLVPDSSGKTVPARRNDRNSPKWTLRSAQNRRSIFQNQQDPNAGIAVSVGETPTEDSENVETIDNSSPSPNVPKQKSRVRGVVETYASFSANPQVGNYFGTNFAVAKNVSERVELIVAGQTSIGESAPQRLETTAVWRVNDKHKLNFSIGGASVNLLPNEDTETRERLGQISVRAVDEWIVRDGIVVVFGIDYSRFIGASDAASVSPRFGLQMDVNANTRVKFGYAPGGQENNIQSAAQFEDSQILFKEQTTEPTALVDGKAVIEKSHRLEFSVERVLSESSSIEATAFFDTTSGRGIGLLNQPLNSLLGTNGETLLEVANQQGAARGIRVVYSKRISSRLSASAGYSFGRGQELSADGITNPSSLFQSGFFQTAAAQVSVDFRTGTQVRTIFRFSPKATVFAIDPFAGRLAVYDPSLSILVTQELPTFGLPVRAIAVIDARNLLDLQAATEDGENRILVNASRRLLRGGISVRF
jgi:hypothetical protein